MSQDFVRCYIGELSSYTLQNILKKIGGFDDWTLIDASKFNHSESYGYEQICEFDRDKPLIEAIARRSSIIAENRVPNNTEKALIWNNALNIADVLTLLSLARARYYPTLLVERNNAEKYTLAWGLITQEEAGKQDIVQFGNFGPFITTALSIIKHNPDWLKDSGFNPSIHWYHQAQLARGTAAPSILEMALYWMSIEILVSVYIKQQGLKIRYKKSRVKRFFEDKGYSNNYWSFLDSLIDDWYQTRCDAFHEGRPTIHTEILIPRRKQVRDLTSLVLIEMLQPLDKTRKEEIAQQIRNYMTIQNDSSNPLSIIKRDTNMPLPTKTELDRLV